MRKAAVAAVSRRSPVAHKPALLPSRSHVPSEQLKAWIAEDEAEMQRYRGSTTKVRLFLDTSVLLAASGSDRGASRERYSGSRPTMDGFLWPPPTSSRSCSTEKKPKQASGHGDGRLGRGLGPSLTIMDDVLTLDRAVVFEPAKDRPILFGALGLGGSAADARSWRFRRAFGRHVLRAFDSYARDVPRAQRAAQRLQEITTAGVHSAQAWAARPRRLPRGPPLCRRSPDLAHSLVPRLRLANALHVRLRLRPRLAPAVTCSAVLPGAESPPTR